MSSDLVAIVTGGAGPGLGSAISKVLSNHGWNVLIADRDEALAAQLVDDINSAGGSARFIALDLTSNDSPRRVVNSALDHWGHINALVLNAGVGCVGKTDLISDEQFDSVFSINVRACFRLVRDAVNYLPHPGGTIVSLASVHGRQPLPGFTAYAATKGAVEAMTRGWAVDLGKFGIRVNCVLPGMVDCPQTRLLTAQFAENVDAFLDNWTQSRQLLPEMVTNTDVGRLVHFLLSDQSRGITGQSIVIDAGTTLMLTDREQ